MSLGKLRSAFPSKAQDVNRRIWRVWYSISDFLRSLRPVETAHRWCFAFRSCRAHIRIQRATRGSLDLGPALVLRDGRYQPNERTDARAEGIERLKATHPWAGLPHFQTFLAGFDVGEKYGMALCQHRNSRDQSQIQTEPQDSSSASLSENGSIISA